MTTLLGKSKIGTTTRGERMHRPILNSWKACMSFLLSGLVSQRSGTSSVADSKHLSTILQDQSVRQLLIFPFQASLLKSTNTISRRNDFGMWRDIVTSSSRSVRPRHLNVIRDEHRVETECFVDDCAQIRYVFQYVQVRLPVGGCEDLIA